MATEEAIISSRNAAVSWRGAALMLAKASRGCGCDALRRVANSADLLREILTHVELVVPDDVPTLAAAIKIAGTGQRIVLRRGEHLASSGRAAGAPGESLLKIDRAVDLRGEGAGATVIRGMLVLSAPAAAAGRLSALRIDDAGDCCVRVEGGRWEFAGCRLRCAHAAALALSADAHATVTDCVLGGEDEAESGAHYVRLSAYGSVQVQGLQKRACYGVVLKGAACADLERCVLRECSEAAVLVGGRTRALLRDCTVAKCAAAFMAGSGRGRALECRGCELRARRLWADADRPRLAIVGAADNVVEQGDDAAASGAADGGGGGGGGAVDLEPSARPRGDDSDGSSTSSLEEQEFADMERLMEELDAAAMAGS